MNFGVKMAMIQSFENMFFSLDGGVLIVLDINHVTLLNSDNSETHSCKKKLNEILIFFTLYVMQLIDQNMIFVY